VIALRLHVFAALLLVGCADGSGGLDFALDEAFPAASFLPPASGPRLVVTNSGDDTLSFVDPVSFTEIARVPVGVFPMELEGAHHVAPTPDGRFLFVGIANTVDRGAQASGPHGSHGTGATPGYLLKIDARTGRQIQRARVDRSPGDVRMQPGGRRVWQSHYDLVTVAEVLEEEGSAAYDRAYEKTWSAAIVTDVDTMERIARVPICPAGHGIGFSPDGGEAYVTCGLSDELAIVDTGDFSVRRVPVAPDAGRLGEARHEPYALTVAPDGRVWVSNTHLGRNPVDPTQWIDNRRIVVVDPRAGAVVEGLVVDLEGTPYFGSFTADGSRFFVVEQAPDRLHAIDPATATIVRTAELGAACQNAHAAVLSPDERAIWVVCEGDRVASPGALLRFDADTLQQTGAVEVGIFPDDVVWLPEAG
jgi:YVTN family beta-propeller protein